MFLTNMVRHGGQLVHNVLSWVETNGYYTKTVVAGASDIEPKYNYSSTTTAWVNGYYSTAPTNTSHLYNYGSCDSCPTPDHPNIVPSFVLTLTSGTVLRWNWSLDDIWYLSAGVWWTQPLPLIYRTDGANAYQWNRVALVGYNNHYGSMMNFAGSFTQYSACHDPTNPGGAACMAQHLDNSAMQGWLQLYQALHTDLVLQFNLDRTATDVTWQW